MVPRGRAKAGLAPAAVLAAKIRELTGVTGTALRRREPLTGPPVARVSVC